MLTGAGYLLEGADVVRYVNPVFNAFFGIIVVSYLYRSVVLRQPEQAATNDDSTF